MYPLSELFMNSDLSFHGYFDDNQFYKWFKCISLSSNLTHVELKISQIQVWMIKNKLKFNGPKTESYMMRTGKNQKMTFEK